MAHVIFDKLRESAAGQAYEIAWDYLARSGLIRDEFEVCVFIAQRITMMVEGGHTNKIRIANEAINQYERYVRERERVPPTGGWRRRGY